MPASKLLYRGFSITEFIWILFLRIAATAAIVLTISNFDENPVVISVFMMLCLAFILLMGDEQVNVYSDKVVYSSNSIVSMIFKSRGKIYKMEKISRAYLPSSSVSVPAAGFIVLLAIFLPKQTKDISHPFFLDMENGETIRIETRLGLDQVKKIVQVINSLK